MLAYFLYGSYQTDEKHSDGFFVLAQYNFNIEIL